MTTTTTETTTRPDAIGSKAHADKGQHADPLAMIGEGLDGLWRQAAAIEDSGHDATGRRQLTRGLIRLGAMLDQHRHDARHGLSLNDLAATMRAYKPALGETSSAVWCRLPTLGLPVMAALVDHGHGRLLLDLTLTPAHVEAMGLVFDGDADDLDRLSQAGYMSDATTGKNPCGA